LGSPITPVRLFCFQTLPDLAQQNCTSPCRFPNEIFYFQIKTEDLTFREKPVQMIKIFNFFVFRSWNPSFFSIWLFRFILVGQKRIGWFAVDAEFAGDNKNGPSYDLLWIRDIYRSIPLQFPLFISSTSSSIVWTEFLNSVEALPTCAFWWQSLPPTEGRFLSRAIWMAL